MPQRTNDGKSSLRLDLTTWRLIHELIQIELVKEELSPAAKNLLTKAAKDIEYTRKYPQ